MFKLNLFTRKNKPAIKPASPVDQAIDVFLDSLEKQPYRNMAAARDAIAIARDRQIDRPVEIWAIYHRSIAHYL